MGLISWWLWQPIIKGCTGPLVGGGLWTWICRSLVLWRFRFLRVSVRRGPVSQALGAARQRGAQVVSLKTFPWSFSLCNPSPPLPCYTWVSQVVFSSHECCPCPVTWLDSLLPYGMGKVLGADHSAEGPASTLWSALCSTLSADPVIQAWVSGVGRGQPAGRWRPSVRPQAVAASALPLTRLHLSLSPVAVATSVFSLMASFWI